MTECQRRLHIGAEVFPEGGVHFRVWAPACRKVQVVLENPGGSRRLSMLSFDLEQEEEGYFSALAQDAADNDIFRFHLDDDPQGYCDPASRFQPHGPHGPSQIIDPSRYAWSDREWKGINDPDQVIYEMHIGTFTGKGTWKAAARELEYLSRTGITLLEIMPVADFPRQVRMGIRRG